MKDQNLHPSHPLSRTNSNSNNNRHRSTISLASTFSEQSSRSDPSSRSSRAFSTSAQSSTTYDDDEPAATHPLSQMGAGRFWAPRERKLPKFSLQQARDKVRMPRDFRWSDPNKPQQPQSPKMVVPERDRVAEAREWIETQCLTAGFGDLDLGRPPSPTLSSKKSSFSLAPSSRRESAISSNRTSDIPPSAEDLQTRIDVLSERIAERERKIKMRQHLERLQAEDEVHGIHPPHRAPSIEVIAEKLNADQYRIVPVELDSHVVTNLGTLEEAEEKEEDLPRYSNPNGVSIMDFKDYQPPPPPHPALSTYRLLEPEEAEQIVRSRSNSLTPRPPTQGNEQPATSPVVMLDYQIKVPPEEETNSERSRLLGRPSLHQRALSAPGNRPIPEPPSFHHGGRGRSVSIDTRVLSPTEDSPSSSTTTGDGSTSTAATTPCEDVKSQYLTVESARSTPPPISSAPATPLVYCNDPIALPPQDYPTEESSLFSELESLAGARRLKPRSSMSNIQRNLSHASQAPMPVRNTTTTTKSKRDSYMAGRAPIPAIPPWPK